MAYPCITQPNRSTPLRLTLCLTREECSIMLPYVKKAHRASRKEYSRLWLETRGRKTPMKQMYAMYKALDRYEEVNHLRFHIENLAEK